MAATIAAILLPGLGYWLIGERKRAILVGGGIIAMFVLGVFIAGVRVVSVPGYEDGYKRYVEIHQAGGRRYLTSTTQPAVEVRPIGMEIGGLRQQYVVKRQTSTGISEEQPTTDPPLATRWVLLHSPLSVLGDNLWFLGQMLTGPLCAVIGYFSIQTAQAGIDRSYARLADIGSLYTAVAGMLNVLVIVDIFVRAHGSAPTGSAEGSV